MLECYGAALTTGHAYGTRVPVVTGGAGRGVSLRQIRLKDRNRVEGKLLQAEGRISVERKTSSSIVWHACVMIHGMRFFKYVTVTRHRTYYGHEVGLFFFRKWHAALCRESTHRLNWQGD